MSNKHKKSDTIQTRSNRKKSQICSNEIFLKESSTFSKDEISQVCAVDYGRKECIITENQSIESSIDELTKEIGNLEIPLSPDSSKSESSFNQVLSVEKRILNFKKLPQCFVEMEKLEDNKELLRYLISDDKSVSFEDFKSDEEHSLSTEYGNCSVHYDSDPTEDCLSMDDNNSEESLLEPSTEDHDEEIVKKFASADNIILSNEISKEMVENVANQNTNETEKKVFKTDVVVVNPKSTELNKVMVEINIDEANRSKETPRVENVAKNKVKIYQVSEVHNASSSTKENSDNTEDIIENIIQAVRPIISDMSSEGKRPTILICVFP